MSIRTMTLKRVGRKACAVVLAVSTVFGMVPGLVMGVASAAKFNFVNRFNKDVTIMTTVAGTTTKVRADVTGSYAMSDPPFIITRGSETNVTEITAEKESSTGSTSTYTIKIDTAAAADPDKFTEYIMNGNLTTTSDAVGTGTIVLANGSRSSVEVTTDTPFGIAETTRMTIELDSVTSDLDTGAKSRQFGLAAATGGYLEANYNTGSVVEGASTESELVLTVNSKTGLLRPITFTIKLGSLKLDQLTQGTEISFAFYRPDSSPLGLQVYSPQGAVNVIASGLQSEKDAYVNEDGKKKIITLKGTDQMGDPSKGISQPFTLESQIERLNTIFQVRWRWEAHDENGDPTPEFDRVLVIPTEGHGTVSLNPELKNVPGVLIADVTFTPSVGTTTPVRAEAKIPLVINGLGTPPKVEMLYSIKGSFNPNTNTAEETSTPLNNRAPGKIDVFDGKVNLTNYPSPVEPFKFTGLIDYGELNGAASKVIIRQEKMSNTDGEVQLSLRDRGIENYTFGSPIVNPSSTFQKALDNFSITAKKKGIVKISFDFYNAKGELKQESKNYSYKIEIVDTSPTDDSTLSSLKMSVELAAGETATEAFKKIYPGGEADFGFEREKNDYYSMSEPFLLSNLVGSIKITPSYNIQRNTNSIVVSATGVGVNFATETLTPGAQSSSITLPVNELVVISVDCTAENGDTRRYTINVKRMPKSSDDVISDLIVKPEEGSAQEDFYDFGFDPATLGPYTVTVPYSPGYVYVQAIARDAWATGVDFVVTPDLPAPTRNFFSRMAAIFQQQKTRPVYLDYSFSPKRNETLVDVVVTPESGAGAVQRTYSLKIIRDDPSDDAMIKAPKLSYWLKTDRRTEIPLELEQAFLPDEQEIHTKTVEYSTNKVKLVLTPNDYRAEQMTVSIDGSAAAPQTLKCKRIGKEPQPLTFTFDNVEFPPDNVLKFKIQVSPESSTLSPAPPPIPAEPYMIYVERQEPSRDLTATITLTNTLTKGAIDFGYSDVIDTYPETKVEYSPGDMKVLVQVKPKDAKTTVKVQGNPPRTDGTLVKLTAGTTSTILVELTAEDGSIRTITIPLKYGLPSKAAYLGDLTVGALVFLPSPTPFDKKKTSYQVEVPKGTTTLAVTAKLLKDGSDDDSTNATITINGKAVKDAEGLNVQLSEKTGKITVVVTAQDGKTKRTYTVSYKNWNLIVPKEENTLKSLTVDYGELAPKFAPSTLEYEVYVKPDAKDIRIYPKLKDKNGAMRVVAGKVLSEFDGAYTATIMEDTMDIFIYVWSEKDVSELAGTGKEEGQAPSGEAEGTGTGNDLRLDKAKARTYVLHLYRNDEEKQGSMKPTTSDEIDFDSADSIVIDITKYPIISADVFNKLKTEYPDKSITFKGNDYTIQCFGADLEGVVPNEESYDLRFSFFTPDENEILDLMDEYGGNSAVDPVYFYFNQHGALPGEMLLTVELGRHYRNQTLYWNYYNDERSRIDYYGYVKTNATGTFSVPISHFSTYMTTEQKVRGAENKSDQYGNPVPQAEENLNAPRSSNKGIPNTGVGG